MQGRARGEAVEARRIADAPCKTRALRHECDELRTRIATVDGARAHAGPHTPVELPPCSSQRRAEQATNE